MAAAGAEGRPRIGVRAEDVSWPVRVPVQVTREGLIRMTGQMGGRPVPMLLDSGLGRDTPSLVAYSLAQRSDDLQRTHPWPSRKGEPFQVPMVSVAPLTLAGLVLTLKGVALPLPFENNYLEAAGTFGADIILGGDVFNAFVVEVDYAESRLALHRPADYHPSPAAAVLSLAWNPLGLPVVGVEAAGARLSLVVDTGQESSFAMNVPALSAKGAGGLIGGPWEGIGDFLRDGRVEMRHLGVCTLGGWSVSGGIVQADEEEPRGAEDGTIGAWTWRRFKMGVDFPGGRLVLEPRPPNERARLGVMEAERYRAYCRLMTLRLSHVDRTPGEDVERALAVLSLAMRADPGDLLQMKDMWNEWGILHYERREYEAAIGGYDRALAINPYSARVWNNRANAQQALGDLDAALEGYEQAVALDAAYGEAYGNMGIASYRKAQQAKDEGQKERWLRKAARAYERAEPNLTHGAVADIYCNWAVALKELGEDDAALERLRAAVERHPTHPQALFNLAVTLLDRGEREEARELAERLRRHHPAMPGLEDLRKLIEEADPE